VPETSVERIEEILLTEVAGILAIDPATVAADAPFQSLGMSSLGFVELLVVIEETFDLKLMETDLKRDDFQTIRSLALRIANMK
jgi:acyl carrier protein